MTGDDLGDGIWRLRADNRSPMTGDGTNSYLIHGPEGAVLIDPGPALPAHLAAILRALQGRRLAAVLVSHAHLDHSALAPALAAETGAQVLAFGAARDGRSPLMQRLASDGLQGGEGLDHGFAPDQRLVDGQFLTLAGLRIEVLHTPGHMAGHLSFALGQRLFSGDHVMGWSTSLISPPDGDMGDYMAALARLAARDWQDFLPGHGATVKDPAARLAELIRHRKSREAAILSALRNAPATAKDLAHAIYLDTPPALLPAAARNILAQLIDLYSRNEIEPVGPLTAKAKFKIL